jgi:hypothetical protein
MFDKYLLVCYMYNICNVISYKINQKNLFRQASQNKNEES